MNHAFLTRVLIVGLCAFPLEHCMAADSATHVATDSGISFDPIRDRVAGVGSGRVAWYRATVVPETRGKVAPSYLYEFFIQMLDDSRTTLVYQETSTHDSEPQATPLPDGTMLLGWHRLLWAAAGQAAHVQEPGPDGEDVRRPAAMYPDGVLAYLGVPQYGQGTPATPRLVMPRQPYRQPRGVWPLWWIPISERKLDFKSKLQLEDGLGAGAGAFLRSAKQIAWLDVTRMDEGSYGVDPELRRPGRIYIFDVAQRGMRWVELNGTPVGPRDGLAGFDGRMAFDGLHIIDPAAGHVGEPLHLDVGTLGVIDGVAYGVRFPKNWPPIPDPAIEVVAIPLDHPDRQHVVYRLPYKTVNPGIKPGAQLMVPDSNLFFITDDTLRAWDGSKWAKVPLK